VAGFTQDDIEITVEKDTLKVSGTSGVLADEAGKRVEYLHKGIAERSFSREWKLSQHQKVRSAELNDGILRIRVEHIVPEEDMPKRIPIQ
jgi:molecular chaperone IbpA